MRNFAFILPFTFLSFVSSPAATLYVVNPAAKLLTAPAMNSGGVPLGKGTPLTLQGESGLFYRVAGGAGSGYVPRLFVSRLAPGTSISAGVNTEKGDLNKVRARASNYAQTAAARGMVVSSKLRTRGQLEDFDFEAIEWLESLSVSPPAP